MPNPRSSNVLAAVCFLTFSFNGLFAPVQALTLAQTTELSAQAENKTATATEQSKAPLARSKIHDTTNPDYPILQKANEALINFAVDKKGAVDWMKALNSGAITPRTDLMGMGKMETLETDIIMQNTKGMPYVRFPHGSHTRWLACVNCHDQIFIPKAGANPVNMTKIFRGQYCGVCHGKVAFITTISCERCHNILHGDIKAWW